MIYVLLLKFVAKYDEKMFRVKAASDFSQKLLVLWENLNHL
jgi:hypothetical protein